MLPYVVPLDTTVGNAAWVLAPLLEPFTLYRPGIEAVIFEARFISDWRADISLAPAEPSA